MTTQTHTTIIKGEKEMKCISDAHYDDEDPLGLERTQNICPIILPQSFKTDQPLLIKYKYLSSELNTPKFGHTFCIFLEDILTDLSKFITSCYKMNFVFNFTGIAHLT